jgi:hypothetical protein
MTSARFQQTPIVVPINAVIHKSYARRAAAVRKALTAGPEEPGATEIRPIISEEELGGVYVSRALEYGRHREIVPRGDVGLVRDLLTATRRSESGSEPGQSVPVFVASEYTCVELILAMRGAGEIVFRPYEPAEADQLPSYLVGYATNRYHERWTQFLVESFELFLECDAVAVARSYVHLWLELRNSLGAAVRLLESRPPRDNLVLANTWADRLLGFGAFQREYTRSKAWNPILLRASEELRRYRDGDYAPDRPESDSR